jgi:tetratricopeptide (TPR) repeat protein
MTPVTKVGRLEVRDRAPRGASARGTAAVALAMALALACPAGGRLARAETPERDARRLYQTGLESYRAGNYDEAIARLKASYQLVPAPGLLYDLAQAQRLKGDCASARTLYRQFLDHSPRGSVETLARSHLAEMDKCVADAVPATVASAPAARPGTPNSGGSSNLAARPSGLGPEQNLISAPSPHRSRFIGRRAALAAGFTALGLAVATGYFAWRADQASDKVSNMFSPGQTWSATGMNAEQSGRSSETLGVVTAVGALLSGGIAAWLATRD